MGAAADERRWVMDDPKTPEEWQVAVDRAYALLGIESARLFDLISDGPRADVDRYIELLDRGRALGITPSPPDVIERIVRDHLYD
jgi:hypothetical protein